MGDIICGNSLDILPMYSPGYFHACITSPPYWGLRDYGEQTECVFGGDEGCEHVFEGGVSHDIREDISHGKSRTTDRYYGDDPTRRFTGQHQKHVSNQFCVKCGAWRGQLGLEPTPDLYVEHLLQFLRAIWRVLRDDGVLWLNLGDSFYGGKGQSSYAWSKSHPDRTTLQKPHHHPTGMGETRPTDLPQNGLKPKDLCLIPFRIALAAQADGWWVRHVIPWYKLNPMPESCDDRPTTGHEYVLLLTKSGSKQYWTHPQKLGTRSKPKADYRWRHKENGLEVDYPPLSNRSLLRKLWSRRNLWKGHDYYWDADAIRMPHADRAGVQRFVGSAGISASDYDAHKWNDKTDGMARPPMTMQNRQYNPAGRNRRTGDWFLDVARAAVGDFTGLLLDSQGQPIAFILPTDPYPEAHFSTFPEALVEPMILTTPARCCSECGAGYERVTEQDTRFEGGSGAAGRTAEEVNVAGKWAGIQHGKNIKLGPVVSVNTLGFRPTCSCGADTVPARVLDLFAGRGTVGKECRRHGRDYTLMEMNQGYLPMMLRYLGQADVEYEASDEAWVQPRLIQV